MCRRHSHSFTSRTSVARTNNVRGKQKYNKSQTTQTDTLQNAHIYGDTLALSRRVEKTTSENRQPVVKQWRPTCLQSYFFY